MLYSVGKKGTLHNSVQLQKEETMHLYKIRDNHRLVIDPMLAEHHLNHHPDLQRSNKDLLELLDRS